MIVEKVAMTLFRNLTFCCGGALSNFYQVLFTIYKKGLNDPKSTKVRVEAVEGLGAMANNLKSTQELDSIKACIPGLTRHRLIF